MEKEKEREIIKLIAAELTRRKMSKTELAAALGCNRRTVYYWFEGKRKLSIDTADKALRLLEIEIQLGRCPEQIELQEEVEGETC